VESNPMWLTEKEVSTITSLALSTLRTWRHINKGMPFYKVGGKAIRYKRSEVLSYIESCRINKS